MMLAAILGTAIFGVLAAMLQDANTKRLFFILTVVCAVVFVVLLLVGVLGYAEIRDPVLLR